jgi:hypothetical protein
MQFSLRVTDSKTRLHFSSDKGTQNFANVFQNGRVLENRKIVLIHHQSMQKHSKKAKHLKGFKLFAQGIIS